MKPAVHLVPYPVFSNGQFQLLLRKVQETLRQAASRQIDHRCSFLLMAINLRLMYSQKHEGSCTFLTMLCCHSSQPGLFTSSLPACRSDPEWLCTSMVQQLWSQQPVNNTPTTLWLPAALVTTYRVTPTQSQTWIFPIMCVLHCPYVSWAVQILEVYCPWKVSVFNRLLF